MNTDGGVKTDKAGVLHAELHKLCYAFNWSWYTLVLAEDLTI